MPRDPENAQSVSSVISYGAFRAADFGDLTQDIEYDLMCPTNPIGMVDLFFASNHGLAGANSPELTHAIQPRVAIVQNSDRKGASVDMFQSLRTSARLEDVWELHWGDAAGLEWNSPGVFIANGVDPQAVATVLTAPPRAARGGPGGFGGGPRGNAAAPGQGAPPGAPGGGAPAAAPAAGGPAPAVQAPGAGGPGGPGGGGGAGGGRGGFGAASHSPAYLIKVSVQPDGSFTITNTRNDFSKTYQPVHAAAATTARASRPAATPAAAKTK
jgi:hypothetical protein